MKKILCKIFEITFSRKWSGRNLYFCFDLDPGNATLNIKITEVNSTKVNISWDPLPVCFQGADNLEYELEVKGLEYNMTLKNYTNTTSYSFIGFLQYKAHKLTITPTTKLGKGAPSTKIFTTPEGSKLIVVK